MHSSLFSQTFVLPQSLADSGQECGLDDDLRLFIFLFILVFTYLPPNLRETGFTPTKKASSCLKAQNIFFQDSF